MRQKSETRGGTPEQIVDDIRQVTRKHQSAEGKIRIVLEELRRIQHYRAVPAGKYCREPVLFIYGRAGHLECTCKGFLYRVNSNHVAEVRYTIAEISSLR